MGGIFGGGKEKTTTTTNNPWKVMPQWMKDALKSDAGFRQDLLEKGKGIAEELGENPRDILGLNEDELLGRDIIEGGYGDASDLGEWAQGLLGRDYESEYTDDVVDTTLAGMDRAAERERLAREGRAAAVGGTTNTRAAVADAVAQQLTGMNKAEMEAKLRDDAFRFGSEMTLEEAGLADQFANSELSRALQGGGALGLIGEKERGLDQTRLDEERTAEQQAHSWLGNLFSGTQMNYGPTGSEQTQTTPGPSTFSQILGAGATVLGGWLSDEDAKEDIVPMEVGLGALKDVTPATYTYKDDAPTHKRGRQAGLIAQELEHIPGAVERRPDGLRQVDPYPVLATVVQAVKELDARTAS